MCFCSKGFSLIHGSSRGLLIARAAYLPPVYSNRLCGPVLRRSQQFTNSLDKLPAYSSKAVYYLTRLRRCRNRLMFLGFIKEVSGSDLQIQLHPAQRRSHHRNCSNRRNCKRRRSTCRRRNSLQQFLQVFKVPRPYILCFTQPSSGTPPTAGRGSQHLFSRMKRISMASRLASQIFK